MEGNEFRELVADIEKQGLRDAITLFQGNDPRRPYCRELGLEVSDVERVLLGAAYSDLRGPGMPARNTGSLLS
jgi:hypothetical protein